MQSELSRNVASAYNPVHDISWGVCVAAYVMETVSTGLLHPSACNLIV